MARRLHWSRAVGVAFHTAVLLGWAVLAHSETISRPLPTREFGQDSVLAGLIRDAFEHRPELAQARSTAKADLELVPQVSALPDPVLSGGLQNDGFNGLQVGKMETSWWSITAAQTVPWFGKRGLRGRVQTLTARQSDADVTRTQLGVQAEVERSYLDLLLVRDQLSILGRLEALWVQAEGLARTRYESGEGAQADILRAQLERSRLQQQRAALMAEERRRRAALNQAVGTPLDRPIETQLSLADLRDPALPDSAQAEADLEVRSPELRKAKLAVDQAAALKSLAHRDYYPDVTIVGGVMPRGGEFETMWQAGVSIPLPLWAGSKQSRAVREYGLRDDAARSGAEAVRRALRERLEERRSMLLALRETNRLFRSGLLVQSEAAVQSAMSQYQVGRVPFASVLEALNGYWSDVAGYYESVVAIQRIDIAQRELSLDPVAGPSLGGLGGAAMPGTSGMGGGAAAPASRTIPPPAAGSSASAMPRM